MKHVSFLLAALVVVLGVQTFTRADPPPGVAKWEYKCFGADREDLIGGAPHAATKAAGIEGWELVTVTYMGGSTQLMTFKRPIK